MELSGWGRYPRQLASVIAPEEISEALPPREGQMISRGQGRSYGDATMCKDGLVMLTERLHGLLSFDEQNGVLKAEAGTTLAQVISEFLPSGWFPTVVPGTKFVSLGGCLAADIHGKNHHRDGAFGAHVQEIELVLADRSRRRCSPENEATLFWSTVGGMGLTGIITEVTLELIPVETSYVVVQHHQTKNLEASLKVLEGEAWDDQYTIGWIDCLAKGKTLGRGILMRGHHARLSDLTQSKRRRPFDSSPRPYTLGFDFPLWVLNGITLRAFNDLYYRMKGSRRKPFIADCESFFFPLDRISDWNRMYGKRGFIQYQCVLPQASAAEGLQDLLEAMAAASRLSFLSVLRRFGPAGKGLLSFPIEGYSLTFDLPISDPGLFAFLDRLDEIVMRYGGRIYLAKDSRLRGETFRVMYPRLEEWQSIKSAIDPENHFDSDLARRLKLAPV
jgi:decaprenylphospho-beta-D-ribofuranose 2-oxidase